MRWHVLVASLLLVLLCSVAQAAAPKAVVSLNKAPVQELMTIDGGGAVTEEMAKAIIDYRAKNGPFKVPADFRKVPGMTPGVFNRVAPGVKDGDLVHDPSGEAGMPSY